MPSPGAVCFQALNIPHDAVPESMDAFELSAPPHSDLWRKPPFRDTATAPILFTALRHAFICAEVTVAADWRLEWDQAGLVIFAGSPPAPSPMGGADVTDLHTNDAPPSPSLLPLIQAIPVPFQAIPVTSTAPPAYPYHPPTQPLSKWVKVGLEFCDNTAHASSVCATADGADWAITSLSPALAQTGELRLKLERVGFALWVYYQDERLRWRKLREVTWFFYGVTDKSVRVGVYASRPASWPVAYGGPGVRYGGLGQQQVGGSLRVEFDGLMIF